MRYSCLAIAAIRIVLVLAGPSARAEDAAAAQTESVAIVPGMIDPDFAPRLGTYHYRFHWFLRIGADAEIEIRRSNGYYHISTYVKTGWFVDRFYRFRFRGEAVLKAADLAPIRVDMSEEIRSTRKRTSMEYRGSEIHSKRVKRKKDKEPRRESYRQSTREGRVSDPFSATLIARAISWQEGDRRSIDIFDGRRLNRVVMDCRGKTSIEVEDEDRSVWEIKLTVTQGDPENLDEDDELITDQIIAYLAADNSREVLQLDADTKFGGIKVVMESFEPADSDESDSALSRLERSRDSIQD